MSDEKPKPDKKPEPTPDRCLRGKKIRCPYPAGHYGKCSPRV